jgi:DUF438 domain-containing protein
MKHLKRFNENAEEEKLYHEIDSDEYTNDVILVNTMKPTENFTKEERDYIQEMSDKKGYYIQFSDNWKPMGQNIPNPEKYNYFFNLYNRKYDDPFIECRKTEDEWFYVAYSRVHWEGDYYKCDQFEGLVQFLKDKQII